MLVLCNNINGHRMAIYTHMINITARGFLYKYRYMHTKTCIINPLPNFMFFV